MKKLLFLLTLGVCVVGQSASAQVEAKIREENRAMSQGSFNALVVELPGTTKKDVEKAWEDFVGDYKGKTKFDKKTDEFFTDEAILKEMSANNVDIYAKVAARTDGTELTVWYNLGVTYLSSKDYPDRYPAADKMLKKFATSVSATMIEDELKAQQKKLEDLTDDLKDLEKDKASRDKDITGYKETIKKQEENIKKAEEDIKTNLGSQDKKKGEIEAQKKVVDDVMQRLKKVKGK